MQFAILVVLAIAIIVSADPVKYHYIRRGSTNPFGVSFSRNAALAPSPFGLSNHRDLFYFLNTVICGKNFSVQLDTGSADLFIFPQTPLNALITEIPVNLTYGDGSFVDGKAAVCPVSFFHYTIPNQTFLYATTYNDTTGLYLPANVLGLMGLGFDLNSNIYAQVANAGPGAPSGLSVLSNLFLQTPGTPNYIAFLFDRASDLDAPPTGSFTVGENHPGYESILSQTALPISPEKSAEWTTLTDSVDVNGQVINYISKIPGTPRGKSLALVDTGTSLVKAPKTMVDAIYSTISGARFATEADVWALPCLAEADVGLTFAGTRYAIHPLDLTVTATIPLNNGTNVTLCFATIRSIGNIGGGRFDMILGDTFLRNVYSLYDFGAIDPQGKPTTTPFMKLLSLINPVEASADFKKQRAKALASLPPAAEPKDILPDSDPSKSGVIPKAVPKPLGILVMSAFVTFQGLY